MSWFLEKCDVLGIETPKIFVETGSYLGSGIEQAISTNYFDKIHSIELSDKWYIHCKERFQHESKVLIHLGDSAAVLERMFSSEELPADRPLLIYLDAHFSGGETAGASVDGGCPVIRELEIIRKHRNPQMADVVVVDDIRLMGKSSWGGNAGDPVYPLTMFDFSHVPLNKIKEPLSHKRIHECKDIDRLIFF